MGCSAFIPNHDLCHEEKSCTATLTMWPRNDSGGTCQPVPLNEAQSYKNRFVGQVETSAVSPLVPVMRQESSIAPSVPFRPH